MTINEALDQYLKRGFGSMNKNDFEVWIFYQLIHGKMKGMSNYQLSIELQIPETKVKRLRYEASLKYERLNEEDYIREFDKCLDNAKIKVSGEKVLLSIDNFALRKFIDSKLKEGGRFSDSSFNSEIVVLDSEDWAYLIEKFLDDARKKEILKMIEGRNLKNGKREGNNLFKDSIINYLKDIFITATNSSVGTLCTLSMNYIFSNYIISSL